MTRDKLIEELKTYQGDDAEMRHIHPMIGLLQNNPDCFWRYDFCPGHMTGSALLINKEGNKVLLNKHGLYSRWMNFGGHADGHEDIRAVALREAIEESGITEEKIDFVTRDIFDVDVHPIAANIVKDEPSHSHFDLVFLLRSETEEYAISEESIDLKWCNFDDARALLTAQNDPRMLRILSKWKNNFHA
jgi:8-oxo-dGTP pyrophosphatase MutT (NUDIX family)